MADVACFAAEFNLHQKCPNPTHAYESEDVTYCILYACKYGYTQMIPSQLCIYANH